VDTGRATFALTYRLQLLYFSAKLLPPSSRLKTHLRLVFILGAFSLENTLVCQT
jgi:hypothetical protein